MPEIEVLDTPVPKARPRLGQGGRVFTPRGTELAEQRIREAWCRGTTDAEGAATAWGALEVVVIVRLARPIGHYGTGRNAGVVRPGAPRWPAVRPDLDNYAKTVLDALRGVAYQDDGQIVVLSVAKVYARDGQVPGWRIGVYTMEDTEDGATGSAVRPHAHQRARDRGAGPEPLRA